jgi:SAM-dependent methyltransferase
MPKCFLIPSIGTNGKSEGALAVSNCTADVLNMGCGQKRMDGAINLDRIAETQPDVIHDLNRTPWPFPDGTFRAVYASDVIEHLDDVVQVMEEIHRVSRNGALVYITVPHFSCSNAFTDPTHRHCFGYSSFDYFTEGNELSFYSHARFRRRLASLVFFPTVMSKVVWRLANRYPVVYERRWAWIFPAWYLYFELEVVK